MGYGDEGGDGNGDGLGVRSRESKCARVSPPDALPARAAPGGRGAEDAAGQLWTRTYKDKAYSLRTKHAFGSVEGEPGRAGATIVARRGHSDTRGQQWPLQRARSLIGGVGTTTQQLLLAGRDRRPTEAWELDAVDGADGADGEVEERTRTCRSVVARASPRARTFPSNLAAACGPMTQPVTDRGRDGPERRAHLTPDGVRRVVSIA